MIKIFFLYLIIFFNKKFIFIIIYDLIFYFPHLLLNMTANDLIIFNTYSNLTKRMAFYANIWNAKQQKFMIPLDKAIEYGQKLPIALKYEYIRIDNGNIPRKLTLTVIDNLLKNN